MTNEIVFVGIAPHPPLLVPEIGRERIHQVQSSVDALKDFSRRMIETNPDTVVIISPHSPGNPYQFGAFASKKLVGDFRQFGAKGISLAFPNDKDLLERLKLITNKEQIPFDLFDNDYPLDHGVLVPMYYLYKAGWQGQILALSFTSLSVSEHIEFGKACREAAKNLGRKIAFIASADLSHYLSHQGPYPFEPDAHLFDEAVCKAIEKKDLMAIVNIDQNLRKKAGECGYRSILVAIAVASDKDILPELLSYECPFGVGYMTAIIKEQKRL
ncbi:MAG: AmmeMemoRadiSam system protein B [Acidobacteria bacterium]|nr:AmmeMemoRadiSam system protein B [Acidobacteriota bacterium]